MIDAATGRLAACAGKSPFATKAQALRALKRKHREVSLIAYRCPFCSKFHLGTSTDGGFR
jgi:hypothetical protein